MWCHVLCVSLVSTSCALIGWAVANEELLVDHMRLDKLMNTHASEFSARKKVFDTTRQGQIICYRLTKFRCVEKELWWYTKNWPSKSTNKQTEQWLKLLGCLHQKLQSPASTLKFESECVCVIYTYTKHFDDVSWRTSTINLLEKWNLTLLPWHDACVSPSCSAFPHWKGATQVERHKLKHTRWRFLSQFYILTIQ